MTSIDEYSNIEEKTPTIDPPDQYIIFIYGVETQIGKAMYERFLSDGLLVIAPTRKELDISSRDDLLAFHSTFSEENNSFSRVINCESYYTDSEFTPEEYIARHQNLIDFASLNGSIYICLSTYQVFSGEIVAPASSLRTPLTLQGSIYSQIEEYLEKKYAANSYVCFRLPLLFSYSNDTPDIYELNIAKELKDFSAEKSEIKVSSNIMINPYSTEILIKDLPWMLLGFYPRYFNVGSLGKSCSLFELSSSLLSDSGVSLVKSNTTSISGSALDGEFIVLSPYNNESPLHDMNFEANVSTNMAKLETHLNCYHAKSIQTYEALPNLKPFRTQDPKYLDYRFQDLPQDYIDSVKKYIADVNSGEASMNEDTNAEEIAVDTLCINYLCGV